MFQKFFLTKNFQNFIFLSYISMNISIHKGVELHVIQTKDDSIQWYIYYQA